MHSANLELLINTWAIGVFFAIWLVLWLVMRK